MVYVHGIEHPADPVLACVGDKDLPEIMLAYQADKLLHPDIIQLVKHIVKQQYGLVPLDISCVIDLRKFYGDHEGFLLSLGTELFYQEPVKCKFQVILMDPHRGELCGPVA